MNKLYKTISTLIAVTYLAIGACCCEPQQKVSLNETPYTQKIKNESLQKGNQTTPYPSPYTTQPPCKGIDVRYHIGNKDETRICHIIFSTGEITLYQVRDGDTLYDLALKNGIKPGEFNVWLSLFIQLHPGINPDFLIPGDVIALPSKESLKNYLQRISP